MKNNTYIKNIKFLKRNNAFYDDFVNKEDQWEIDINEYKNPYALQVIKNNKKVYLDSLYNKENESRKIRSNLDNDSRAVILFGIGDGRILKDLYKYNKSIKYLIVIEPSKNIFQKFLKRVDLNKLVALNSKIVLHILVNETVEHITKYIMKQMRSINIIDIQLVVKPSYAYLFNDYYAKFSVKIRELIANETINMRTLSMLAPSVWTKNTLFNMRHLHIPAEEVAKKVNNLPVLLVMAGPSLDKNKHLIKEAKKKMLVMAVGSAIDILEKSGIKPHFRVAYDGGRGEYKLFNSIKKDNIPLLYGGQLYGPIVHEYKDAKVHFVSQINYLEKYLFNKMEIERKVFSSGFSVANISLDIACKLFKSKTVVFIGQDLSISERRYAAGREGDKEISHKKKGKMLKRKDIFGNTVYTDNLYLGMKFAHERNIKDYPEVDFINATEGGLPILGTRNDSFENVLKNLKDIDYSIIDIILKTIGNYDYTNYTKNIISNLIKLQKKIVLLKDDINILTDLIKTYKSEPSKDIYEKIIKNYKKMIKDELFAEVIYNTNINYYIALEKKYKAKSKNDKNHISKISEELTIVTKYLNNIIKSLNIKV